MYPFENKFYLKITESTPDEEMTFADLLSRAPSFQRNNGWLEDLPFSFAPFSSQAPA